MLPRLLLCTTLILWPVHLVRASASKSSEKKSPVTSAGHPPSPVGDPSWALGLRLYQALRSEDSVNTLFSPLLLASSLRALGGGSAGSTALQLQDLLKTPSPNKADTGDVLSGALKSFTGANRTSFMLHASSALFSKEAPKVLEQFTKESQARFRLQHHPLGKGDHKGDLKQLQGWAKAALGGLEGDPLQAEIHSKTGALLLANALRFKGLWEREFGEESKDLRTFLGKKYTKVMMMHRAGLYRHHEDVKRMVQVLEVPLWGGHFSVVLLLPFHVESLARLEKLLTLELLTEWLEKSNKTSVSISLPKANISSTLSLQKQLSALGLTDAWDQKAADFSGVSGKKPSDGKKLHLGGVLQWTSFELAPQAGSGEAQLAEENVEKPKMFYADHPFILLVRDSTTGALLLMGALDHAEGEALHDEL